MSAIRIRAAFTVEHRFRQVIQGQQWNKGRDITTDKELISQLSQSQQLAVCLLIRSWRNRLLHML